MLKILKTKGPAGAIITTFYILIFTLPAWFNTNHILATHTTLTHKLFTYILIDNLLFLRVIGFLMILVQGIIFFFIGKKSLLFSKSGFLPTGIFVLVSSSFPDFPVLTAPVLANTFILWALYKTFDIGFHKQDEKNIFDAAILFSIAGLIYTPYLILLLFMYLCFLLLGVDNWKQWIIGLLGIAIPLYFSFTIKYMLNMTDSLFAIDYDVGISLLNLSISHKIIGYLSVFVAGVCMLAFYNRIGNTSVKQRRIWILLLWFNLLCISISIALPKLFSGFYNVLALPFSFWISYLYINMDNNILKKIIGVFWISLVLFANYYLLWQ